MSTSAALPPIYLVSAARTPIGAFLGSLSSVVAPELGATAIRGALARAKLSADLVNEVYMGNVLTAGIGQAPARQAAIKAGIPNTVPAVTVSKVCGSGMQAVIFGAKSIALGDADLVIAGGMESMSNVPYYVPRGGLRMGNGTLTDGMIHDGLWDPYDQVHMGTCGDSCAKEYKFSREAQDEYAKESFRRALAAEKEGMFDAEIEAVSVPQRKGDALVIKTDEGPAKSDPTKFAALRPAFGKEGTITAANASPINDGASAILLASEAAVKKHNLTPMAKLTGYATAAQAPVQFTTAPSKAMASLFEKTGTKASDVDLFEINEAFAVVAMVNAQLSGLDLQKVNVRGGAVALGHPIGSSGSRILTTLAYAMKDRNAKRGVASICIGGGEGLAVMIEKL